ncbi:WD40-repeat-containing domain protein [Suillus paluster]|uniref:WD40-repeat-containing domain protein n=1 Tax=Suillus paluster TaxID=48578 RepID=UPI001B87F4CF|nr:WD40-repeat-containing domain protein [Suillus paluster]KAG1740179.1 WD40-repeat-containing domain protein [Suillus paluster]
MGHRAYVSSVRWSRDGRRVLSGSNDGTARQWKVENGETILAPIETGHKHVYVATYSPDRALIATAGYDKSIKIWDAKTNNLVTTLHTDKMVNCLAWTPDGTVLISGSFDHSIRTWSTRRWQQIAALYAHTDCVFAIAVSPNGRILASASYDNTARLWNLENGQPISLPLKHADIVTSVSFSADGKLLATGCYDRDAYTWDVSAILRDAGRVDLLSNLNEREKPLLDAATRRLAQQLEYVHQAPPAVVDSSRDHVGSSTYQPPYSSTWHGHATSAPSSALDRFPSSSTSQHELATSAPSSSPHRYQPDADVAPQISPHPPSAFSSPTPRTVGQRTSRVYVAPRGPITQATSQRQVRQDPNQGRAPLFPVAVVPTTYPPSSLSPPRPRPQVPVSIIPPTVTPITQETGCCTRFWRSICCGCNDSSDDHS